MAISDLVMKKLVIMKQFFNHGSEHADKKNSLGNMLAIHHFDFAVEMLLKIVATEFSVNVSGDYKFNELWSNVNSKYKETFGSNLLLEGQMKKLHVLRNNVQHSAIIPSDPDVDDFKGYTLTFLNLTIQTVFNINFSEIILSKLIIDKDLLKYINDGEIYLKSRDYNKAIEHFSLAFSLAIKKAIKKFGDMFSVESNIWAFREIETNLGKKYRDEIADAFEHVEKNLYLLALDVNLESYKKFVETSYPVMYKGLGGSRKPFVIKSTDEKTKAQAEFCYKFVVDTLVALGL